MWDQDDEEICQLVAVKDDKLIDKTGVRAWFEFCKDKHLSPLQVSVHRSYIQAIKEEWVLCKFAVWLRRSRGIQGSSISSYVSQARSFNESGTSIKMGMECSMSRWKTIGGELRSSDRPQLVLREALEPQELVGGSAIFDISTPEGANLVAGLQTGAQALLRGGELGVSKATVKFDGSLHLSRADVVWCLDAEVPHIKLKLYPVKKRLIKQALVVLPYRQEPGNACRLITNLFNVDLVPEDLWATTPLFRNVADGGRSYHTDQWRDKVREVVKHLYHFTDDQAKMYGAHSLRIGGATLLFRKGLSEDTIRLMGRWDTDIHRVYLRLHEMEVACRAAEAMATS